MQKKPLPRELVEKDKKRRVMRNIYNSWYGSDVTGKVLADRDRVTTTLADALGRVSEEIFSPDLEKFTRIQAVWKDVSGPVIGKLTTPLRVDQGILYLGVRHSMLLRELPPALDLVKKNLADKLGSDVCCDIKLEVF